MQSGLHVFRQKRFATYSIRLKSDGSKYVKGEIGMQSSVEIKPRKCSAKMSVKIIVKADLVGVRILKARQRLRIRQSVKNVYEQIE